MQDLTMNSKALVAKYKKIFIVALICLISGFVGGVFVGRARGIPFMERQAEWSIGIYNGESPFDFTPAQNINNPVLTAQKVTDVPAEFVADPFMVEENSKWYMFFEVMNKNNSKGSIGLATSDDGYHWTYKQIVLKEPFHLSYPYVFKFQNEYYMVPESHESYSIRLYKAVDFPTRWTFVKTLVYGNFSDPSIIRYGDKWWLFVGNAGGNDMLNLYYADELTGPWKEHPGNPVIKGDKHTTRPGGRILVLDNKIIRYVQDDALTYGGAVRAFEVTELTTTGFKQNEVRNNPILEGSGKGWNAERMHNLDPHQIDKNKWIACVDGYRRFLVFGLKY
ncbi:MAG: hypothetical protein ABR969_02840 [Sedimentisphaerales bacterium]|jgi:hypothetical protein